MDIQALLEQRKVLRRKALYAVGHEAYTKLMAEIAELDKQIPWVQYRIKGANAEQRHDGEHWEFQSLHADLAGKPLIEWTIEELQRIPWRIEDLGLATIEKI